MKSLNDKKEILKKVKLKNDTYMNGYGVIKAGTKFEVKRYNTRYVYVKFKNLELQLSRKDVEKA